MASPRVRVGQRGALTHEREKPGQPPCRWHWLEVPAGQCLAADGFEWGKVFAFSCDSCFTTSRLRKPSAPPLSSEISFCCIFGSSGRVNYMLILFLLRLLSFLYLFETVCFPLDLSLRLSLDLLVSVHCPAAGTADSPSSRAAGHQLRKKPAAFTSTPPPPPSLVQERPCRDPCGEGPALGSLPLPRVLPVLAEAATARSDSAQRHPGGAQMHIWGPSRASLSHPLILKKSFPRRDAEPHVLPEQPGTDVVLGSGNGAIPCAGWGRERDGLCFILAFREPK